MKSGSCNTNINVLNTTRFVDFFLSVYYLRRSIIHKQSPLGHTITTKWFLVTTVSSRTSSGHRRSVFIMIFSFKICKLRVCCVVPFCCRAFEISMVCLMELLAFEVSMVWLKQLPSSPLCCDGLVALQWATKLLHPRILVICACSQVAPS